MHSVIGCVEECFIQLDFSIHSLVIFYPFLNVSCSMHLAVRPRINEFNKYDTHTHTRARAHCTSLAFLRYIEHGLENWEKCAMDR